MYNQVQNYELNDIHILFYRSYAYLTNIFLLTLFLRSLFLHVYIFMQLFLRLLFK